MTYIILTVIFLAALIPFMYLTYKFRNPYKLVMVFGKKGSGKTTFLAKTAYKYLKKGYHVFSTEKIPGCYHFDVQKIGDITFPENSVLLIDEVGMIWDNRNFKTFRPEVRDYFKYQRHEKHIVYLFSQTFDVDLKLRNLTDCMYLCRCHFGWLSVARKIKRSIILVHPQGDAESRIADDLDFEPIWWSLFGAETCVFTFIPRWTCLFNSHEKLGLPMIDASDPEPIPATAAKLFKFQDAKKKKSILKKLKSKTVDTLRDLQDMPTEEEYQQTLQQVVPDDNPRNFWS